MTEYSEFQALKSAYNKMIYKKKPSLTYSRSIVNFSSRRREVKDLDFWTWPALTLRTGFDADFQGQN